MFDQEGGDNLFDRQFVNNRFKQDQDNDGVADYLYDAGGNTTKDALGKTFIYDAENKQTEVIENSATIGRYFYDGDGKRVKKISATETVIFIYDAAGKLVAEYANQIAQPSEAKVSYLTSDHLGSPRINTDANGNTISRHDYQPFGEEIQRASYATDAVRKQFTSYERDNESELDFAQARYYNSKHGRFTSTDPIIISDAQVVNPQGWNLYVYVSNNPLAFIDPTGLERVRLGQHTDQEINSRQSEIDLELQNETTSEERRQELYKERTTLEIEREGNRVIGQALSHLQSIGELQGLYLSDFTISTDSSNDFKDDARIKGDPGKDSTGSQNIMWVLAGSGDTQIYVNLNSFTYQNARRESNNDDYGVEDATRILSTYGPHERSHRDSQTQQERLSEQKAYTEQLRVLQKYGPNAFKNKTIYNRGRQNLCIRSGQKNCN